MRINLEVTAVELIVKKLITDGSKMESDRSFILDFTDKL